MDYITTKEAAEKWNISNRRYYSIALLSELRAL